MNRRPTIHDVAEDAAVSVSTVSQVLRGVGRISEDTRRKVQRSAKRLNYVPDRRAVAMRSVETRDVGLLIHRIANPFNAEVVAGASACLQEHGHLVFVLDAEDDVDLQEKYLRALIGGSSGGLLWIPATGTRAETAAWVAKSSPATVTWMRVPEGHPFDHVGVDNAHGAATATAHLLELGHRQIAFLGGNPASPTISRRIGGCVSALVARGLGTPVIRACEETRTHAKAAMMALLEEHPGITGVVCASDVVAAGATLGLAALGLRAGADVSVIGFDDIEDAALWEPPLSTIAVDPKGIGRQIAETFLARKRSPSAPVRTTHLPIRLIARASTGPAPQEAAHGQR